MQVPAETSGRMCKRCGYLLDGLGAGACPECGRVFDPSDPCTFVVGAAPLPRWVNLVAAIGCVVQFSFLLLLYTNFVAAWVLLGRRPMPSMDDPSGISGLAPWLAATAPFESVSCFLAAPVIPTTIVLIVWFKRRGTKERFPWVSRLIVTAWATFVALAAWDPLRAFEWIMD